MIVMCLVWYETGEDSPWFELIDTTKVSNPKLRQMLESSALVDPAEGVSHSSHCLLSVVWEELADEARVGLPRFVDRACNVWLRWRGRCT